MSRHELPAGLDEPDAERIANLRKMKLLALSLLAFAAAVYLFTRWLEHRDGQDVAAWVGYVRAAAEAGIACSIDG